MSVSKKVLIDKANEPKKPARKRAIKKAAEDGHEPESVQIIAAIPGPVLEAAPEQPEPIPEPDPAKPSKFAKVISYIKSNWKADLIILAAGIISGFILCLATRSKPRSTNSDAFSYKLDSLERRIEQVDHDKLDTWQFEDAMKQRNATYRKENNETQSKISDPGTTNDDRRRISRELSGQK